MKKNKYVVKEKISKKKGSKFFLAFFGAFKLSGFWNEDQIIFYTLLYGYEAFDWSWDKRNQTCNAESYGCEVQEKYMISSIS